jgi:hypothetical protein
MEGKTSAELLKLLEQIVSGATPFQPCNIRIINARGSFEGEFSMAWRNVEHTSGLFLRYQSGRPIVFCDRYCSVEWDDSGFFFFAGLSRSEIKTPWQKCSKEQLIGGIATLWKKAF